MLDQRQSHSLTDGCLRTIGEQIAFAANGADLAWRIEATLHAIMLNPGFIRSGASQGLVDHVVAQLGQAIEPLKRHYDPGPAADEVEIGLNCAATIVRSYALSPTEDEMPSDFDCEMWMCSVAYFRNLMLNEVIFRRLGDLVRERGSLGRFVSATPAAQPSTMH